MGGVSPIPSFMAPDHVPTTFPLLAPPTRSRLGLPSLSLPCFFLAFQASVGATDKRGEERPLRLQRLSALGQGLESRASWGGRRLTPGACGLGRAGGLEGSSAIREP